MFSLHWAVFPLRVCIPIDFNSTLTSAGPNIGKDPLRTSQNCQMWFQSCRTKTTSGPASMSDSIPKSSRYDQDMKLGSLKFRPVSPSAGRATSKGGMALTCRVQRLDQRPPYRGAKVAATAQAGCGVGRGTRWRQVAFLHIFFGFSFLLMCSWHVWVS